VSSELLTSLPCKRFLLSSNGKNYHHPDKEAVARVIKAGEGTALYFNYRTEYNEEWDDSSLKRSHRYSTTYPGRGSQGLRIDLDR